MNELTIAIIASLPGIAAAVLAYRQAIRAAEATTKNETLKVEAGAYERARHAYEAGIQQLEEQVDRLRKQVAEEQNVSNTLRRQLNELEDIVVKLGAQLIRAGIELPPYSPLND